MAQFIQTGTDNPFGRTWAGILSLSDNSIVYQYGQKYELSA